MIRIKPSCLHIPVSESRLLSDGKFNTHTHKIKYLDWHSSRSKSVAFIAIDFNARK